MVDEFVKVDREMLAMYSRASSTHNRWNNLNETVRKLVRPTSPSFTGSQAKGQSSSDRIYDSTAVWAAEQLSSGLHANLMDPSDRWFSLGLKGIPFERLEYEQAAWLEQVSDIIFTQYGDPRTRMQQSVQEVFSDVSSYGTGVLFQEWNSKEDRLHFRAYPLSSCKIEEGHTGLVDTIFRDMQMTVQQIQQEFPKAMLPDNMKQRDHQTEYKVTHAVFPNEKHVTTRFVPAGISKRYASVYFIEEGGVELERGGYDVFPYSVPRWTTMAGEIYGRGPAITASPDIQLLNLMVKELIMAAQLANRPPLVLDEDFMLPVSYTPGSLLFKTPGSDDPTPLQSGGNFSITLELLEQKRAQIAKTFHVDWLLREKKKERQSVHEISDDRQEMLKQLSPVLGRLESELSSPTIRTSFYLLDRAGKLPLPPEGMAGKGLEITYSSPAAKSKDTSKAQAIMQYLADLAPVAQIDQSIYEGINFPELGQVMAVYRDVTRRVLLSPEEKAKREKERKQKEAQEMRLQQAQQVGQVAGALDDVASAQQKGLVLGGL